MAEGSSFILFRARLQIAVFHTPNDRIVFDMQMFLNCKQTTVVFQIFQMSGKVR